MDKKQIRVEFPEAKILEETLNVTLLESKRLDEMKSLDSFQQTKNIRRSTPS